MKGRKVKITIWYNNLNTYEIKNEFTTTVIIDECYLLDFMGHLIREDIQKVEGCEYNE